MKIVEKKGKSVDKGRDNSLLSISSSDSLALNESLAIIESLTKKHNLNLNDLAEILKNREKYLTVPIGIFRGELCPLESLVRYLKEALGYNLVEIARMLNRDETTIWATYKNSTKKIFNIVIDIEMKDINLKELKLKKENLAIPVSLFSDRNLSVLESLCLYLKETYQLNYHNIGLLLRKDERTIWTVIYRARKKRS